MYFSILSDGWKLWAWLCFVRSWSSMLTGVAPLGWWNILLVTVATNTTVSIWFCLWICSDSGVILVRTCWWWLLFKALKFIYSLWYELMRKCLLRSQSLFWFPFNTFLKIKKRVKIIGWISVLTSIKSTKSLSEQFIRV